MVPPLPPRASTPPLSTEPPDYDAPSVPEDPLPKIPLETSSPSQSSGELFANTDFEAFASDFEPFLCALRTGDTALHTMEDHADDELSRCWDFYILDSLWRRHLETLADLHDLKLHFGDYEVPPPNLVEFVQKVPLWQRTAVPCPNLPFFHASRIQTAEQNYIACAAPHKAEREGFWRMVVEEKVPVIVNLMDLTSSDATGFRYMEDKPGDIQKLDNRLAIYCLEKESLYDDFIVWRHLKILDEVKNTEHKVVHLHYPYWPDGRKPIEAAEDFMNLIDTINEALEEQEKEGPILIHCLAGIGRTGTLITIHSTLREIEAQVAKRKSPKNINVNLVRKVHDLRKQRWGMVQTPEQFAYAWKVLGSQQNQFLLRNPELLLEPLIAP